MTNNLRVSIIVLNYNGLRFLDKCLDSLRKLNFPKDQYEILLVDNGSVDGSIEFLEKEYKDVILIKNKKNLGVCLANNIGIERTNSEYVVLLNNDLHLHKDFVKNLVEVMDEHPKAGCCGGEEFYYDDNIVDPTGDIRKTSWMGSGATIYRRKALDQSGLFDDSFFFYCEDIDLSWKIKLTGWDIYQNEKAVFYHDGKNRKVRLSDKSLLYSWRNRLYLLIKYATLGQMKKSLGLYFSRLILKKNTPKKEHADSVMVDDSKGDDTKVSEEEAKKASLEENVPLLEKQPSAISKKIHKLFFLCKLCFSFLRYFPDMVIKRYKMQKKITNHNEVDSWINYVDNDLRN
jgi:GT2 family glycosyltransferase